MTRRVVFVGAASLFLISGSAVAASAWTASDHNEIHACVHKTRLTVRIVDPAKKQHCTRSERAVSWNVRGAKGATGATGPAGPAGPKGDTGASGATGPAGVAGPKGDTGETGPAGPRGDTGSDGPKGDTGDTGPQGATGPAGPKGDKGDPGPDSRFGTNTAYAAAGRGAECTIGAVWLTAGSVAGATIAAGQTLPISQNQALFSLLGTTYGGNGTTTFQLPDLRGAAPNGLTYVICTTGVYPSRG
jgi:Phage Tail Collar Domain/Collagen triple helix repeat (20 copies)